jgi:hypothetical protein
MEQYTLTNNENISITGTFDEDKENFTKRDMNPVPGYSRGKEIPGKYEYPVPAAPATFTETANNTVWKISGGRKRRSSKTSKKGGNKHTMTMGGKKHRKSKKGGKKSKKNGKKTRRH